MTHRRGGELPAIREHFNFIPRNEPPPAHGTPCWHGPLRIRRPVRTAIWWDNRNAGDLPESSAQAAARTYTPNDNDGFLLRIFNQPDPIARSIASFLTIADINSLRCTCKSFREALTGDHADWSWILRSPVFGNEHEGATNAFNGLRRLTNRVPFWDNKSIQTIFEQFDITSALITVNLDYTAINSQGVYHLLINFPRLVRISIRYCKEIKLQEFQEALESFAALSNFARLRLKAMYIDYWHVAEIYDVINTMLVNQARFLNIRHVAEKIRYIARMVRSNVFLCHRNHGEDGVLYYDRAEFLEGPQTAQNAVFYPCEIKDVDCTMCDQTYEKRFCLKCWATQICSYCHEFHCPSCVPETYRGPHGEEVTAASLAVLRTFKLCCSDISSSWFMTHYFHDDCWTLAVNKGQTCTNCDRYICTKIPTTDCPRCWKRQCIRGSGYNTKVCQHCGTDFMYDAPVKKPNWIR
ncbi:hypothetical protein AA313_de0202435 [Arthrobotrys entomopaga]|nr:hypothetical protein AA313_de0202435 [Arthrobotrys entomopaga]